MINDIRELCLSKVRDCIVCRDVLGNSAKCAPMQDDVKGIDIYCLNDKIDTKYQPLGKEEKDRFVWFEENKLNDYDNIKTTRLMIFFRQNYNITTYIDVYRDNILKIIDNASKLNNTLISYRQQSNNVKTKNDGTTYYDKLCYIKYDWLKRQYSNIIKTLDSNTTEKFKKAYDKIIKMNIDDIYKYLSRMNVLIK